MGKENFKELVLKKAREGKVVFLTADGPMEYDLEEFIKQPAEGILYDRQGDGPFLYRRSQVGK